MKTLALALVSLTSSMSFALVRQQASCTTSDGAYSIEIIENQGTGPVRPSPGEMTATVKDADGNEVLSTQVEIFRGLQSISFGRPMYRDVQTSGDVLELEGPSTNFKNYILTVLTPDGKTINDNNMVCTVFLGEIL